jgi:hypothetical protein
MLFPHHFLQKEHKLYMNLFFLELLTQNVKQNIVIRPCNVQKCCQDLIFQMKSSFDFGGQYSQAVRRSFTISKAELGLG